MNLDIKQFYTASTQKLQNRRLSSQYWSGIYQSIWNIDRNTRYNKNAKFTCSPYIGIDLFVFIVY